MLGICVGRLVRVGLGHLLCRLGLSLVVVRQVSVQLEGLGHLKGSLWTSTSHLRLTSTPMLSSSSTSSRRYNAPENGNIVRASLEVIEAFCLTTDNLFLSLIKTLPYTFKFNPSHLLHNNILHAQCTPVNPGTISKDSGNRMIKFLSCLRRQTLVSILIQYPLELTYRIVTTNAVPYSPIPAFGVEILTTTSFPSLMLTDNILLELLSGNLVTLAQTASSPAAPSAIWISAFRLNETYLLCSCRDSFHIHRWAL